MAVYLVRGEHVVPVARMVTKPAVTRGALQALLRGPTATELRAGYATTIPAQTALHDVTIANGTATVDLTRRFEIGGGSLSMLLRLAQVVHTATQFPNVHRVAFRLDGRQVRAIGGEGVIVSPPVDRADFEAQAPPILVERPLRGDVVRGPVVVRGTANVFEARLFVDVVSSSGRTLAHRAVLATAGTGTRGRFETRIALPAGRVMVIAYARSPKNGMRIALTRIPIAIAR